MSELLFWSLLCMVTSAVGRALLELECKITTLLPWIIASGVSVVFTIYFGVELILTRW